MRHEKLARDNIPAIIAQHGEQPVTRILEMDEYKDELRRKLYEEAAEFCATGHVEELAAASDSSAGICDRSACQRGWARRVAG